jgi:dTDP-4-amino-4,6-dideoxygalactose transaminase
MKEIPFLDLAAQHKTLEHELTAAYEEVVRTSAFIRGPFVTQFEMDFATIFGVENVVSCANGTDALYLAMKALDVKPGDQVIVPAHTWISTSEMVTHAGAEVVFCDTELESFTLSLDDLREKINERTVGIIPVHLFGHPVNMSDLMAVARANNLWVIEDCAQAHLSEWKGQMVGTFGDAATFSFYPGKNLGAMGDAGAVITNDDGLAARMKMISNHGARAGTKHSHEVEGINSRLDGLQAAILSVKLKYLRDWTDKRRLKAAHYSKGLDSINGLSLPTVAPEASHTWHQFVVKTESRDALKKFLADSGIPTVIHYPVALPFLNAYAYKQARIEDFPNAFSNQERILSLPIYPELSSEDQNYVISAIKNFFNQ